MSIYYGLIIPRSYNDYFSRSNPQELLKVIENSDHVFNIENGGTGANNAANARENLGIIIESELNKTSENLIQNKTIANLIPANASSDNELADKAFVNSSIGTNTANYISNDGEPFTSLAALEAYAGTVTNNDYAFITGTDEAGNVYYDRYKATVSGGAVTWAKEYRLNNSSFTAEQWAAIQSGITANIVSKINNIPAPATTTPKAAGTAAVGSSAKYAKEDHVHPQQTSVTGSSGSCTGNAASATALHPTTITQASSGSQTVDGVTYTKGTSSSSSGISYWVKPNAKVIGIAVLAGMSNQIMVVPANTQVTITSNGFIHLGKY